MRIILKHIKSTDAGTFHYRRRIPKDVAEKIGRSEFKRLLGDTEREALRNYPTINLMFEELVEAARRPTVPTPQPMTPIEIRLLAEKRASELAHTTGYVGGRAVRGDDPEFADILRDSAIAQHGEALDPVERTALNLLVSSGRITKPKPTLQDACRMYSQERVAGAVNERKRNLRVDHVMRILSASIDANKHLDELTREDARRVRDYMLNTLKQKPATVRRYIGDIRAIVNLGLQEFDSGNVGNPFNKITVATSTHALDERHPYSDELLREITSHIADRAGPDLQRIWSILAGTGCRLAEVAALLVSDVRLDHSIPYIDVGMREHRRIKNNSSIRRIPLIGDALTAAREAVAAAGGSQYLFEQYAGVVRTKKGKGETFQDATFASNALMKHVRAITDNEKLTVHSLRHTMEDRLIRGRVEEFDRNLVLGHTSGGMGERYGGPDARLEAAHRAMLAAFNASTS